MNAQDRQSQTLTVLNRLRDVERKSLLPRLAEVGAFVQLALSSELDQVNRMILEQVRHDAWLMEAAEGCHAALHPPCADVHSGNLHYLDLAMLLPRVIANIEALVQVYSQARAASASLLPEATETIARIHNRHQVHLEQLREMQARLQTAQPA